MADHLKADITQIRSAASTIAAISKEFNGAGRLVAGYDAALGDRYLAGKLHEFADNWDIHRKRLTEDLEKFATWAREAADAYERGDRDLAAALREGASR